MYLFFFFNDTATTEIYTLSLHDALPIFAPTGAAPLRPGPPAPAVGIPGSPLPPDRKSTRLNSSHLVISYAVFCLKKKNRQKQIRNSSFGARLPTCRRSPSNH